jgi:Glycosyl hydrolase family 9/Cellulase N-terminal ig-like domain
MIMRKFICILLVCSSLPLVLTAQDAVVKIHLNQIGFYPDAPKVAVIAENAESEFLIKSVTSGEIVFKSKLSAPRKSQLSDKVTRIADFSAVTKPGVYIINIPGLGDSFTFEIKPKVNCELTKTLLKGFYFQRMSTPLLPEYAGKWSHAAGHPDTLMPLPSWDYVKLLGYYTLSRFENKLTNNAKKDFPMLKERIIRTADKLTEGVSDRAYMTVMGKSAEDFIWGSNSVATNEGILLIQAFKLTNDKKYLNWALTNLDYILGRNATGYSFVTGYGHKTPLFPHHRQSEADGVTNPVPGLIVGGPNRGQQDGCKTYPSNIPDESYTDSVCSYASNEIAINWNAPAAYLAGALEALYNK